MQCPRSSLRPSRRATVPLGKAARHQAEADEGMNPNPVAPPKGAPTASAHQRLRRQAEGQQ